MPFPKATCGIAVFLEKFCDGRYFKRQAGVVVSNGRNSAIELGTKTLLVHPGTVSVATRVGVHMGPDEWKSVKRSPEAANASMFGVSLIVFP